jgi:hypothetical protein
MSGEPAASESFFARALDGVAAPSAAPTITAAAAAASHSDPVASVKAAWESLSANRLMFTAAVALAAAALIMVAILVVKPPFTHPRQGSLYEPRRANAGVVLVPIAFAAAVALAHPARLAARKAAMVAREHGAPGPAFPKSAFGIKD